MPVPCQPPADLNEQKNSRFESDSKEGIRLVRGDSKQGSQKQDNLTSTREPTFSTDGDHGKRGCSLCSHWALAKPHLTSLQQGLPCLRHRWLPQFLRQTSICCATNTNGGLRPRISTPTLSSVNKNHKWVFLIPDESEPEIQFSEKQGGNLKAKQAYGAGFLGASIASGWFCSSDPGFGSSRRIESPQVHVNFIEATTNEFLHGGRGLN